MVVRAFEGPGDFSPSAPGPEPLVPRPLVPVPQPNRRLPPSFGSNGIVSGFHLSSSA